MSNHDQHFFDTFMLILGILVGVAVGLFFLSRFMGDATQGIWSLDETAVQEQIEERIAPAARVAIAGIDEPEAAQAVIQPEPVQAKLTGPQVYNEACQACHAQGVGGAPVIGDPAIWTNRIAQGRETLEDHVINGYQGEAGYMPPKGGRLDLSDEEILAALDFMLEESQ